jgi:hypothetical protein
VEPAIATLALVAPALSSQAQQITISSMIVFDKGAHDAR